VSEAAVTWLESTTAILGIGNTLTSCPTAASLGLRGRISVQYSLCFSAETRAHTVVPISEGQALQQHFRPHLGKIRAT